MAAIRGAICAQNTAEDISRCAVELVSVILERNALSTESVEAVIFSATADLDACYPASAVRKQFDLPQAAFFCTHEMNVVGSLDHCLRVLIIADGISQSDVRHCYLGRASELRPDLK